MEALNKSILDLPACCRQVPVPQEALIQSELPYGSCQTGSIILIPAVIPAYMYTS